MTSWSRSSGNFVLVAIAVMTLMSGCGGGDEPATNGSDSSGSGTATSVTAGSESASPAPTTSGSRSPVPIAKGDVYVRLAADRYPAGATVHVTVSNGMEWPIHTTDFKTACSIVTLQRSDAGTWTDIVGCRMGRPTRVVEITPGQEQEIELDPHSSHLGGGTGRPAFGSGTYRVIFTYRAEPTESGEPLAAYSPEFTIG